MQDCFFNFAPIVAVSITNWYINNRPIEIIFILETGLYCILTLPASLADQLTSMPCKICLDGGAKKFL
jgi:hypothetical protein